MCVPFPLWYVPVPVGCARIVSIRILVPISIVVPAPPRRSIVIILPPPPISVIPYLAVRPPLDITPESRSESLVFPSPEVIDFVRSQVSIPAGNGLVHVRIAQIIVFVPIRPFGSMGSRPIAIPNIHGGALAREEILPPTGIEKERPSLLLAFVPRPDPGSRSMLVPFRRGGTGVLGHDQYLDRMRYREATISSGYFSTRRNWDECKESGTVFKGDSHFPSWSPVPASPTGLFDQANPLRGGRRNGPGTAHVELSEEADDFFFSSRKHGRLVASHFIIWIGWAGLGGLLFRGHLD